MKSPPLTISAAANTTTTAAAGALEPLDDLQVDFVVRLVKTTSHHRKNRRVINRKLLSPATEGADDERCCKTTQISVGWPCMSADCEKTLELVMIVFDQTAPPHHNTREVLIDEFLIDDLQYYADPPTESSQSCSMETTSLAGLMTLHLCYRRTPIEAAQKRSLFLRYDKVDVNVSWKQLPQQREIVEFYNTDQLKAALCYRKARDEYLNILRAQSGPEPGQASQAEDALLSLCRCAALLSLRGCAAAVRRLLFV